MRDRSTMTTTTTGTRTAATPLAAALLLALLAGAGQAHAQAAPPPAKGAPTTPPGSDRVEQARIHYERGLRAYDENTFETARIEFERAYELAPSYRILYNLGNVSAQTADFVGAIGRFTEYLAQGGSSLSEDRRGEVSREINMLKAKIGRVEVVAPAGATILVDDAAVGKAPLDKPLEVNPGRRRIGASLQSRVPAVKLVDVASGDFAHVTLDLTEVSSDGEKRAGGGLPKTVWLAWGGTAVLAAGAGAFGIVALKASSSLDSEKKQPNADPSSLSSDVTHIHAYSITADALTLGAVAMGAFSLYLTLKASKDEGAPAVMFTPGGVSFAGKF